MADNRLYRSETDRILGGVCGGIAEVYDFDPSVVRLITLLLIITGVSPLLYLIAWLIIPSESEVKDRENVEVDQSQHEEPEDEE
ncbi:PspC domain-containing protein [Candidatus Nanohaloarchaea archaeon]|nr:PspC domain-containing protein [Candidatus Nanohaloarchaea archaeon]